MNNINKELIFEDFVTDFWHKKKEAMSSVDVRKLKEAFHLMVDAYKNRNTVFTIGNGGSSAIANHFVCDHSKLVREDTDLLPKIHSLSENIEIITAIGNDMDFEEIFRYQLSGLACENDILFTISSSGDSQNIINAILWAKENNLKVISLSGFSGGRSRKLADVSCHVESQNYGIIEDTHMSIVHLLAQLIKAFNLKKNINYTDVIF